MNKRVICVLSVLFAALFVFAACEKRSKYGALIVDKEGMEHVVATDENGVTILDKRGFLVEIMTDSKSKKPIPVPTQTVTDESGEVVSVIDSGEYATNPITFPNLLQDEEKAENKYYYVSIPEGWTQEGELRVVLRHTETQASVSFHDVRGTNMDDVLAEMDSARAKLGADGEFTQSEVKIKDKNAVLLRYVFDEVIRETYLLENDGKVFQVTCTVTPDMEKSVDFAEVLETIVFK